MTKQRIVSIAAEIVVTVPILLGVSAFAHFRMRTVRSIREASVFLAQRHTEEELRGRYRLPPIYSNWSDIPSKFQRGLRSDTNCTFYFYSREGMPYWYFIAALNRESRVIDYGVATNL